jgi:deoxyribose-phosphate aldolase
LSPSDSGRPDFIHVRTGFSEERTTFKNPEAIKKVIGKIKSDREDKMYNKGSGTAN